MTENPSYPYFSMVERLEAILAALPIDEMFNLKASTGRPGYGPQTLFRAYVATFILNSSSIAAALRTIADNPNLSKVIGGAPTKYALSRLIAKLKDTNLFQRVMDSVAESLKDLLPDLGTYTAMDSTDIKAWARRTTGSDPDAGTSVKKSTHGFKQFWYGCKTHLIADAGYDSLNNRAIVEARNAIPIIK